MNGKQIHDAMEHVGHDLIDSAENMRFSQPIWRTLLPVAAAAAILIGAGFAASMYLQPPVAADPPVQEEAVPEEMPVPEMPPVEEAEPAAAYPLLALFPQLDAATLPEEAAEWETFYINEAGLEDSGTDIYTTQGDQVLALDARNGVLLIRVQGKDYRGVLAIANDPQRLSQQASSQIGISGETVGTIAEAHNGILAITGSRILDEGGNITGRAMAAYTMCDGVVYQEEEHLGGSGVRLEINEDGQFFLTDPQSPVEPDTRNAVEVPFALIRDGDILVEESVARPLNQRACIGQAENGEIFMLVVEGRRPDEGIFGIDQWSCAQILKRYGCENGVQLDTGTSAILWFDGECVVRCSNKMLPEGRPLPTAFVVERIAD